MHTFMDNTGAAWTIHIDTTVIKRVRLLCGVDLMKVVEGQLLDQLAEDTVLLVDVLFVVMQPQVIDRQLSAEQFAAALVGDAIDAAVTALVEDLISFFQAGKRTVLANLFQKLNRLYEARTRVALTKLEAVPLDQMIEAALNGSGASSTSSPASPA